MCNKNDKSQKHIKPKFMSKLKKYVKKYVTQKYIKKYVKPKQYVKIMSNIRICQKYIQQKYVEKYVNFFSSIFHHNSWYFWGFVFTEFLNFVILFGNFWITDKFLQGKFWYFGSDVMKFELAGRENGTNPYCEVFPLVTSCSFGTAGTAGGENSDNPICILSQNIINQKIYLVLWFWMTFLMVIVTPICLMYRIVTIFFDPIRSFLLMGKFKKIIGKLNSKLAKKYTLIISHQCRLQQIAYLNYYL
jgi:hypothetical protein